MIDRTIVRRSLLNTWVAHKQKWDRCRLCPLSRTRQQVVHYRGHLPCDVLIVGEAPGTTEDQLGIPFSGEAGRLAETILGDSMAHAAENGWDPSRLRIGYTNPVGCLPLSQEDGTRRPTTLNKKRCQARFLELVAIANPRLIVCMGQVAKWAVNQAQFVKRFPTIPHTETIHPSALLRMDSGPKRDLEYKRAMLRVSYALGRTI